MLLVAAVLFPPVLAGGGPPSNVVLIVVDTLRADRLGCYGNEGGFTPFLDTLAARGVVFANAHSTSSWTNPSVASLFTSRYPSQHRVTRFMSRMPAQEVTLAEVLASAGWTTGGFTANPALTRLAYGQGFQTWAVHPKTPKLAGGRLVRKVLKWLDRPPPATPDSPRLLYVHFMEPHSPYAPPAPYRERFAREPAPGMSAAAVNAKLRLAPWGFSEAEAQLLESLYDAEVAVADAAVRGLIEALDARGTLANAMVIVTADHGEEFREHGGLQHGTSLFNELVRVPLILVGGGLAPRTVRENVSLIDVAPTILDLVGLPAPPPFEGRSLRPLAHGEGGRSLDVIAELFPLGDKGAPRHSAALVRGSSKLLLERHGDTERPVTYDLRADPGEIAPNPPALAATRPALASALAYTREALARRAASAAESMPLDAEAKRKLQALGYIR